MQQQIVKHITTSTTTNVIAETCYLLGAYIAVNNPGTSWKVSLKDKSTPANSIAVLTLSAPSGNTDINGKISALPFPTLMFGGIDIVTAGTAGDVDVWLFIERNG